MTTALLAPFPPGPPVLGPLPLGGGAGPAGDVGLALVVALLGVLGAALALAVGCLRVRPAPGGALRPSRAGRTPAGAAWSRSRRRR